MKYGNHLLHAIALKCDTPDCGYEQIVAEISASLVGAPCPKCGANLLNERDFESAQIMKSVLDSLAELVPGVAGEAVKPGDLLVGINPHGNELKLSLRPVK